MMVGDVFFVPHSSGCGDFKNSVYTSDGGGGSSASSSRFTVGNNASELYSSPARDHQNSECLLEVRAHMNKLFAPIRQEAISEPLPILPMTGAQVPWTVDTLQYYCKRDIADFISGL